MVPGSSQGMAVLMLMFLLLLLLLLPYICSMLYGADGVDGVDGVSQHLYCGMAAIIRLAIYNFFFRSFNARFWF